MYPAHAVCRQVDRAFRLGNAPVGTRRVPDTLRLRQKRESGYETVYSRQWTVRVGPKSDIHPSSFINHPSAFTLVELLVVIVIISMLVGLLMPAMISARGRARIAQCTNNQHELSLAVQQYDGAKQHLPGYINRILIAGTSNYAAVSWVPVLFPFWGETICGKARPLPHPLSTDGARATRQCRRRRIRS